MVVDVPVASCIVFLFCCSEVSVGIISISSPNVVYISLAAVCKDKDILQAVYHKEVIEYFMNYRRFSEVLSYNMQCVITTVC